MQSYDVFRTSFGWVGVLGSDRGIRRTTLPYDAASQCTENLLRGVESAIRDGNIFCDLKERFIAYFDGADLHFQDIGLDLTGAPEFSLKAWEACRSIPRGETRTYKWLAAKAGRPTAPRAAGQAMARNPVPIVVPCHRVVGSDGSLRGFGSGDTRLDLKRMLLDMESAQSRLV